MRKSEYRPNNKTKDEEIREFYRKYAKGIISRQELYDILLAKGAFTDSLDTALEEKIDEEYEEYIDSLSKKSKDEIIEKSYETTVKNEIRNELKNMVLHDKEKAILLDTEDVLSEFYADWLDSDIQLSDILLDTIEDSVATATKYYNKQGKFKPYSLYFGDDEIER